MKTIFTLAFASILFPIAAFPSSISRGGNGGNGGSMDLTVGTNNSNIQFNQAFVSDQPSGQFLLSADDDTPAHASGELDWSDQLNQTTISGSIAAKTAISGHTSGTQDYPRGYYAYLISITEPTIFHLQIHTDVVRSAGNTGGTTSFSAGLSTGHSDTSFSYDSNVNGPDFQTSILLTQPGNYELDVNGGVFDGGGPSPVGEINAGITFTASVPEPSTWITMLGGLAILGCVQRFRRRP